jgi:hypothetical protein
VSIQPPRPLPATAAVVALQAIARQSVATIDSPVSPGCPAFAGHDDKGNPANPDSAKSSSAYLIANGFTGEPTAPVIGMAGATNRNS